MLVLCPAIAVSAPLRAGRACTAAGGACTAAGGPAPVAEAVLLLAELSRVGTGEEVLLPAAVLVPGAGRDSCVLLLLEDEGGGVDSACTGSGDSLAAGLGDGTGELSAGGEGLGEALGRVMFGTSTASRL